MEKGKLIVIEGVCDSVGKSTQSEYLIKRLEKDGKRVFNHHFPTYDENGIAVDPEVRKLLDKDDPAYKNCTPYEANKVFANDRKTIWEERFEPVFNNPDNYLLFDRYTTSSFIYQSSKMSNPEDIKRFINDVSHYEFDELGLPRPDLVIFLCPSYDLAMRLMAEREKDRSVKKDVFEADPEGMRRIYNNALFVAEYLKWNMVKCDNDGEMRSREDIHEEIYRLVKKMDK